MNNMTFIVAYVGNVIIPIDFYTFQRGSTTNQMDIDGYLQQVRDQYKKDLRVGFYMILY